MSEGPIVTTSAPHDEVGQRIPHAPASTVRPSRIVALASVGVSRESVLTAAIAVGAVIVVKFAIALVQLVGNAIDFDPAAYASGFLHSPIGLFLGSLVLYPFPFYLAAFVVLAALFPVDRSSTLTTVLARTLLTGAMGTIVLALVGFGTGIGPATRAHSGTILALDVVFIPLSTGLLLTALLLVGATVSWLWVGSQEPADTRPTEPLAPADLPPAAPESPTPSGVVAGDVLSAGREPAVRGAAPSAGPGSAVSGGVPSAEPAPREPDVVPGAASPESPASPPTVPPAAAPPPSDWSRFQPPPPPGS